MANIKINFGDIPDNLPPEGEAEAVITKVELKTGKDSGKPYLNWEFELLDPEFLGRKVWMITSLADTAIFRLKQTVEALGIVDSLDLDIDEETNLVTSPDFVDTEVTILIKHNTWQDEKRAQASKILDYHTTHHLGEEAGDDEFEDFDDEDVEEMSIEEVYDEVEVGDTPLGVVGSVEEEVIEDEPAPKKTTRRRKKTAAKS